MLQAEEGEGDGVEHFRDAPEKAAGAPAAAKQGAAGKRRGGGGAVRAGGASPDAEEAEEAGQEEEEGDSEEEAELAAGSSEEEEEEEEAGDSDADLMPGALPALSVLPPHQQQQERQRQRQRDQQAAAAAARWPTSKDAYDMNKRCGDSFPAAARVALHALPFALPGCGVGVVLVQRLLARLAQPATRAHRAPTHWLASRQVIMETLNCIAMLYRRSRTAGNRCTAMPTAAACGSSPAWRRMCTPLVSGACFF